MLVAVISSCNTKKRDYAPMNTDIAQNEVTVNEVHQTGGYTYLLVQETSDEYWIAVSKTDVSVGDNLYFVDAMEMQNFESKELNKTFDKILFVDYISKEPISAENKKKEAIAKTKSGMKQLLDSIKISPVEGGYNIEGLYENSNKLKGSTVKVRGQVIKINENIMDRNWVHLMDGTRGEDRSDLTVTTTEVVQVGDTVTFEGTLSVDREFGAGYVYPLIVEDAVIK